MTRRDRVLRAVLVTSWGAMIGSQLMTGDLMGASCVLVAGVAFYVAGVADASRTANEMMARATRAVEEATRLSRAAREVRESAAAVAAAYQSGVRAGGPRIIGVVVAEPPDEEAKPERMN